MNIGYCWKCVYHVQNSNFHPNMYDKFVSNIKQGFVFDLDVLVAKKNGVVVSSCGFRLYEIISRISLPTPTLPEDIDYVCNSPLTCYKNIWGFMEKLSTFKEEESGKISIRRILQYYHTRYNNHHPLHPVCSVCMCNFITSPKDHFMHYFL